jgi:hypothetical protein
MGPDFSSFVSFIHPLASALSVDMSNFTTLREGVFWIILNVIISLCVVWLLLVLMILNRIDIKLERYTI